MSVETIAKQIDNDAMPLNIEQIRADFPVLARKVHGKPLAYLDNAATTQKPFQVIETVDRYYREYNANIHRGVHTLSEEATAAYEGARDTIRDYINAASTKEIIFVRGTTEAINLVAQSFARTTLQPGDEVLISEMEHHSNIVPWQLLREQAGIELKVAPIDDNGDIIMEEFQRRLTPQTKLVSVAHYSNALGTINPIKEIIDLAHGQGAKVLIDGAQAVAHTPVDVQALDCDFYAFSSHKMFGPTGAGILYGKRDLLEAMPPYQGGGDMIKMVTFEKTLYSDLPCKFEAGTPHIAGFIGMGAAIEYIKQLGLKNIADYEHSLLEYGTQALQTVAGLRLVGTAKNKGAILSFVLDGIHPHDLGTILDHEGIAVRTGHHCAMPVMDRFKVPATVRASMTIYNTTAEIDALVQGLHHAQKLFS